MATAVALALAVGASAASAEALSPWWDLTSGSQPTNLVTGKTGEIVVTAENRGDASTAGELTVVDRLPTGITATAIDGVTGLAHSNREPVSCVLETLTCTFGTTETENSKGEQVPETLRPYEEIEIDISVSVGAGAVNGESNTATVSGGGATRPASVRRAIEVDGRERFGVEDYELIPENAGGSLDTQAGSHPFQLTSVITLNTTTPGANGGPRTVGLPRDISAALPAGLIADPSAIVRCSEAQFEHEPQAGEGFAIDGCPAQSVIGVATVSIETPPVADVETITTPIFNLAPLPGEPARFAIHPTANVSAFLETSLRSGGDYGVTLALTNLTQEAWLLGMKLTVWGVPGDQRHDGQRGLECLREAGVCPSAPPIGSPPLLSMPAACAGPLQSAVEGDSWPQELEQPGVLYPLASATLPALDGCDSLSVHPEIDAAPDGAQASTPNGFDIDVHIPQTADTNPEGLAQSPVRDITLALPEGVALNLAVADGLEACSEGLVGFTGFGELNAITEPGVESPTFTAKLPGSLDSGELLQPGVNFCPNAAKIGTVKIKTPLLANPLEGAVYLAAPYENPFGSLVTVYVVAEEPESGVLVKLPGELTLDPGTGQITASFQDTPQLPFEEIDLDFFEGERAPLSTPARCGVYTTTATFVPWSGEPPVSSASDFEITSGAGGGPCPGASLPFSPSITAGTTSLDAGSFTPLTATISRVDGQQAIQSVQLKLPPGVSALIAGVEPCPEAEANAGTCGPESEIGETTISAGLGGDPYTITGGRVYLTEGYEGAPFGISIVSPASVGPFDLQGGRPIVIRGRLEVDTATAALTITTGPIPHILEGFPLQISHLNLTIDRPGFTMSPTSCKPMEIAGTIAGDEGASSSVAAPFQLANCASLKFEPKVAASTAGRASRADGASLRLEISNARGRLGSEANVSEAKFDLPVQLSARLTTIQKACLAATFEADPAACPPASRIGTAIVHTEVLPVPLQGPVYFVSYGGAKFPEAVLVLQGDGVTVDLHGETFINAKTGVTSVTFHNTPDVPFESIEVTLPTGPFSEFGPNLPHEGHDLCGHKLVMPTFFKAQNGLRVSENTPVSVTGCPKALTKAQKLAAALKACRHKDKKKAKRESCEKAARKKYATKVSKPPSRRSKRGIATAAGCPGDADRRLSPRCLRPRDPSPSVRSLERRGVE